MNEYGDIERELQAMRAEPRPEFARELDERAARWLRTRPRWRLPSPRVAIPAAAAATAAAAVVIALAVSGGNGDGDGGAALEVAVVPDQGELEALGGGREAPLAAPEDSAGATEDSAAAAEGGFSPVKAKRVEQGRPVTVRYFFTAPTEATVELAGREATVTIGPGSGRIEISTEGLRSDVHRLEIVTPAAPLYRERIETGG